MPNNSLKTAKSKADNFTDLQLAVNNNDLDMVKAMLASKTDPNELSTGPNWTTALHVAASTGNLQAIALLLEAGANPYLLDSHGRTVQTTAMQNHHMQVINVIQEHINRIVMRKGRVTDDDSLIEIEIGDIPGFNEESFHKKCSKKVDHYSDGGDPCLLPSKPKNGGGSQRPTSVPLRRSKTKDMADL
jgi:ankyrin repeat protein